MLNLLRFLRCPRCTLVDDCYVWSAVLDPPPSQLPFFRAFTLVRTEPSLLRRAVAVYALFATYLVLLRHTASVDGI